MAIGWTHKCDQARNAEAERQARTASKQHDEETTQAAHVLVVDRDPQARLLAFVLRDEGYSVTTRTHGNAIIQDIRETRADLVLLDVTVPTHTAFEQCRVIRRTSSVPIIFLSEYADIEHKVLGLRSGADDYLGKPYEPSELLARVAALLRRRKLHRPMPSSQLTVGAFTLDTTAQQLLFGKEKQVDLTPTETRLLHYLMTNANTLVPLDDLCMALWRDQSPDSRVRLQVNVYRLRKKIAVAPDAPCCITTVRQIGYQFHANEKQPQLPRARD